MGLFQNVMAFGILAGIGAVLLYFRSDRMVEIADTARASLPRAALVGVAGSFLFFPVWILGIVVLAISIVGIPVLLLWIPFFPLLMGFGSLVGAFAVAMVLGEWVQEKRFPWMEWAEDANPVLPDGIGATPGHRAVRGRQCAEDGWPAPRVLPRRRRVPRDGIGLGARHHRLRRGTAQLVGTTRSDARLLRGNDVA